MVNTTVGSAATIYPFFGASMSRFRAADDFAATMSANVPPPAITAQPTNHEVAVGEKRSI